MRTSLKLNDFYTYMEISPFERSVFEYLFELEESNINTLGAHGFIIRKFNSLSLVEAYDLVEKWLANYDSLKELLNRDKLVFKD